MSEVLDKCAERLDEVYEVVQTVEVIHNHRRIRIEVLKQYHKNSAPDYDARYWEIIGTPLQRHYTNEDGESIEKSEVTQILCKVSYSAAITANPEWTLQSALNSVFSSR